MVKRAKPVWRVHSYSDVCQSGAPDFLSSFPRLENLSFNIKPSADGVLRAIRIGDKERACWIVAPLAIHNETIVICPRRKFQRCPPYPARLRLHGEGPLTPMWEVTNQQDTYRTGSGDREGLFFVVRIFSYHGISFLFVVCLQCLRSARCAAKNLCFYPRNQHQAANTVETRRVRWNHSRTPATHLVHSPRRLLSSPHFTRSGAPCLPPPRAVPVTPWAA